MNKEFLVDFFNKLNIKVWIDDNFIDIDINKKKLADAVLNGFINGELDLWFINTKYKGMSFNGYGPFKVDSFCEWTNQPLAFRIGTLKYEIDCNGEIFIDEECPDCWIRTSIRNNTKAYDYMLNLVPFLEFDEDVAGDGDEDWDAFCSYEQIKEIFNKINIEDYLLIIDVPNVKILDEIK